MKEKKIKTKKSALDTVTKIDIAKLIDTLGNLKLKIKNLTEEEKSYVAEVKRTMAEDNLSEVLSTSGEFKAVVIKTSKGEFKEKELLEYVKKTYGKEIFDSITTTKLDEEKLENALFNEVIHPAEIKKFQTIKESERLLIK